MTQRIKPFLKIDFHVIANAILCTSILGLTYYNSKHLKPMVEKGRKALNEQNALYDWISSTEYSPPPKDVREKVDHSEQWISTLSNELSKAGIAFTLQQPRNQVISVNISTTEWNLLDLLLTKLSNNYRGISLTDVNIYATGEQGFVSAQLIWKIED